MGTSSAFSHMAFLFSCCWSDSSRLKISCLWMCSGRCLNAYMQNLRHRFLRMSWSEAKYSVLVPQRFEQKIFHFGKKIRKISRRSSTGQISLMISKLVFHWMGSTGIFTKWNFYFRFIFSAKICLSFKEIHYFNLELQKYLIIHYF